jgi:hypothetical protein
MLVCKNYSSRASMEGMVGGVEKCPATPNDLARIDRQQFE